MKTRLCNKINQYYYNEILGRLQECTISSVYLSEGVMSGNAIINGATVPVSSPLYGGSRIWDKVA